MTRHEPIDHVVSKRLRLLQQMAQGMQLEVSTAAAASGSAPKVGLDRFNKLLRDGPLACEAEKYNEDARFAAALSQMLEIQREVLTSLSFFSPDASSVDLRKWSLKSAERVQTLCAWIQADPPATSLDLSGTDLRLDGGHALGAALRENRKLRTLLIAQHATVTASPAQLPVQELLGHAPVRTLNLAHRKLGALAGCILSELIACNPALETLDLSANMLGQRDDAGCVALAHVLKARMPAKLKHLKLANNYIGDAGAHALVDALVLASNRTLETLDLSGNEVGGPAALELAAKLQANSSRLAIRTLRFRGNGLDPDAMKERINQLALTGLKVEL